MKFLRIISILAVTISSLALDQTPTKTGKTTIEEQAYNTQLEKCKVDTNTAPSSGKTTVPQVKGNPKVKIQ